MRKLLYLLSFIAASATAQVKLQNVLIENRTNPVGLDTKQPRFSWQLVSDKKNVMQSAYEIKVIDENKKQVWASGKVNSDQSVFIPYGGPALASNMKYTVQVKVWDNANKASNISEGWWQTAFFDRSDWKAKWIMSSLTEDSVNQPSPMFRKEFSSTKKIASATAYITAQGVYDAVLNGNRIGDIYLAPGWTSYNQRLQYQQYDVTSMIANGKNAIGIIAANGWYRGNIGFQGQHNYYGKQIGVLFQLMIKYTDGTSEVVVSDESWKCATGSVLRAEIYHGETIDKRKSQPGFDKPGFDDSKWLPVKIKPNNDVNLVATYNEPIRKHETFKPVKIFKTPKGDNVIDFGQNLVGWVQVKAIGKPGDKITIYHSEVLDKEGNFYIDNLRAAKQMNEYILSTSEEMFTPTFTFQGFRYILVEGYPGELKPENFTATALYSDMKQTGTFTSSNPLINQLQHNIQWGQRGNFLDVPTDCPQRDERLGWTGDAQAFARTASFNFGVNDFFAKWLKDVALDQVNGSVPFVVPNVLGPNAGGSAGWADAATIIPWAMYTAYGDKRILEDQHESMKNWVGFMERNSTNYLWNKGFHFGDWLFYRPFDDNDGRSAVTDKYLIAQCFFANSVDIVVKSATVLGKQDDVAKYSALLKNVKDAFVKEYVTPNGRLVSGTQTAFVLALNFDMLPEEMRKATAERLVQNIKSYDNHLTTGFLGTPYLCHVLSRFGYSDVAYTLLLQETYPSWLYPVKMGATTIWERWDGIKPDGTFQTPGMNSFNHYAYGAIGDWMYRVVAGIDTKADTPGYKGITIKPTVDPRLTSASAEYQTYYGKIKSAWKIADGRILLDVEIPANTKATVYVPGGETVEVGSGVYSFSAALQNNP